MLWGGTTRYPRFDPQVLQVRKSDEIVNQLLKILGRIFLKYLFMKTVY